MTLKNTDNEYRITVSNRQTIDSETDTIEETAYGNYTEKNGKQYITYKTENDGDKISSMIKIDGNEILIKRTGSVNSSMRLIQRKSFCIICLTAQCRWRLKRKE